MDTTAINSTDFLITIPMDFITVSDNFTKITTYEKYRDESIEAFFTGFNTKLEHLPKNLGEKFPNLLTMSTHTCSIKTITKESFRGLSKLQDLNLQTNQIEIINDDTFDFIPAVVRIALRE